MSQCVNLQFLSEKGLMGMGQFGSQKVRSVINGAIFNGSASNLVCAHYYYVAPTWKTKKCHMGHIWTPFGVLTLFGAQKF